MNLQTLERRLAGLSLGGIRYFEKTGSTNDEAADWATGGAPDFSLVLADEQTAGRGRGDRKWFTHPGSALAFSLILRPNKPEQRARAEVIQRFAGLGALGVSQVLRNQYGLNAEIKWPNDVLLNRRKACGILAEAHWIGDQLTAVILGIGINVAPSSLPLDEVLLYPATCIENELGKRIDRVELLQAVLAEIIHWRAGLLTDAFIQKWELNLAFRGEQVQIISTSPAPGLIHEGRLLGLNHDGELRLRNPAGETIALRNGEIPPNGSQIQLRPVDSSSK